MRFGFVSKLSRTFDRDNMLNFFIQLVLDYCISLKARHNEVILELKVSDVYTLVGAHLIAH